MIKKVKEMSEMIKVNDLFTCKVFSFHEYSYGYTAKITKVFSNGEYELDNKYKVTFSVLEDYFCEFNCAYADLLRAERFY